MANEGAGADIAESYRITGIGAGTPAGATFTFNVGKLPGHASLSHNGGVLSAYDAFEQASGIVVVGTAFSFTTTGTLQDAINAINNADIGVVAYIHPADKKFNVETTDFGSDAQLTIASAWGDFAIDERWWMQTGTYSGQDAVLKNNSGEYSSKGRAVTVQTGEAKGLTFEFIEEASDGGEPSLFFYTTTFTIDTAGLAMQVGANATETMVL